MTLPIFSMYIISIVVWHIFLPKINSNSSCFLVYFHNVVFSIRLEVPFAIFWHWWTKCCCNCSSRNSSKNACLFGSNILIRFFDYVYVIDLNNIYILLYNIMLTAYTYTLNRLWDSILTDCFNIIKLMVSTLTTQLFFLCNWYNTIINPLLSLLLFWI